VDASPESATAASPAARPGALNGVRVLDFTQAIAGPYCTKVLADYGAEVLKIERPRAGDPARQAGPFPADEPHPERSGMFLHLNTNKRGITLDLRSAFGRAVVEALAETADLVVESFRPGVMERLGLNYDRLAARNPRLVYTSISSFGQNGPYRDYQGSDLVFYAIGGEMHSTGLPEREPVKLAGAICQYQAGYLAAAVTLMALFGARRQGQGQYLDCSVFEAQAGSVDRRMQSFVRYIYAGYVLRRENNVRGAFPNGVYPCRDGYFDLDGGGIFFPRTCQMIGRPDLVDDPRFRTTEARSEPAHKDAFEAIFRPWLLERTKRECMEAGQAAKVYCGAVFTPADVLDDPHYRERGFFVELYHPETGPLRIPGAPFQMSRTPWAVRRPAPLLGQHNAEIIGGHFGFSREEQGRLAAEGLI
jgi:crotonobetainyl-CoA:carnitine CoA-transferase CaiB-like acyl-CoA transferase